MIKYKETLLRIPYTRAIFFLKKKIKNQWEVFLCTYEYTKKKRPFDFYSLPFVSSRDQNTPVVSSRIHNTIISTTTLTEPKVCKKKRQEDHTKFFCFQEDKFSPFNFLIFAKILDFLGKVPSIKTRIRTLLKLYNQHFELERFFQIQSMNNTALFLWLASLLIDQIYRFLRRTRSKFQIFNKSILGSERMIKKLKKKKSWLFFTFSDLLLAKWYQNKIHDWAYRVLAKNKKTQIHQNSLEFCAFSCTSTLANKRKTLKHFQQEERSERNQFINTKNIYKLPTKQVYNQTALILSGINKMKSKNKRLINLFKNVVFRSKVLTQAQLIQRLNHIIYNWENLVFNSLKTKNTFKLNSLLSQLLWQWGLARHRKQKAKWIKNCYWSINPVHQFSK